MPTALLAVLFLAVVLADARSAEILALDSYAFVLADARPLCVCARRCPTIGLRCSTVAALAVLTTLSLRAAQAALVGRSIDPLFLQECTAT
jgi:hypothetical protein